jgi:hypothetical protein
MATFPHAHATVTIDGVKVIVPTGLIGFQQLVQMAGLNKKTAKLTVVTPAPVQPTTINANDSYVIVGGEVMTSTKGA